MTLSAELVMQLRPVLEEARAFGFFGPGPTIDEHINHAAGFARLLAPDGDWAGVDLGSGGGLPGLVLALTLPSTSWVLLDAHQRRTEFLTRSVAALGLESRVRVVRERAEMVGHDPDHRAQYEAVVARSFGPPAVTAECAAPLLKVGGRLVVSEPPEDRARWSVEGLAELQLEPAESQTEPIGARSFVQTTLCPMMYPRRTGIPAKRPLF